MVGRPVTLQQYKPIIVVPNYCVSGYVHTQHLCLHYFLNANNNIYLYLSFVVDTAKNLSIILCYSRDNE